MKLLITGDNQRLTDLGIEKGKTYEVLDIVQKDYLIAVPMKQKGKFKYVLINDEDGEPIDWVLD